jgi:NADH-quinone oxidoreductase subunit J
VKRYLCIALIGIAATRLFAADSAPATEEASPDAAATQPAATTDVDQANPSLVEAGSTMETILFFMVAGVAAASALGCVLSVNIVRMAVCLFGTLGSVAILYFLMAANFLGAIQLIVYAGGTLIVIIFGVMLTSKSPWVKYVPKPAEIVAGAVVCLTLFAGFGYVLTHTDWGEGKSDAAGYSVAQIGRELLTTYLVPFELASVLLLAVMIGAAYLVRPERRG